MLKAGDVVVTDFPGAAGIKRRPALVLSSDVNHTERPDAIVGILTSNTNAATASSDCILSDWQEAGLRLPSAFRAYVVTLPQSALSAKIGRLSARDWNAVRACLAGALAAFE